MNIKEYAEALLRLPEHMLATPIEDVPMTTFRGTVFACDNANKPPAVLRFVSAHVGWKDTSEPEA